MENGCQSMERIIAAAASIFCFTLFHLGYNVGGVEGGACGLFVFGDSYTDTGESAPPPYGMTWPGVPGSGNRSSDGRNEVDYFAELFDVPTPTPWEQLDKHNATNNGGVNFGLAGASVTYAYGHKTLNAQVDKFTKLAKSQLWTQAHLRNSVALVSIGINDYTFYNIYGAPEAMDAIVANVVDGIAINMLRIQRLGIRHIMVANIAPGACMPYSTLLVNNSTACIANDTINTQTMLHNSLLEDRVKLLNRLGLHGADIIILNMTKAFQELFYNGEKYGFVEPFKPCCSGLCGNQNTSLWEVCADPTKSLVFDFIHPSQAGWKAIVNLYAAITGYTAQGPKLNMWKKKHHI